jgi:hypothetical protein
MAVESASDRAVFVNPVEFGVSATYGDDTLNGILDSDYFAAEIGARVAIEGARLRFICRSADLPSEAAHGDSITIDSADYVVREIHPDGNGMTELVIEAQ